MDDLTARQRRLLEFIAETVRERGYPPTVREIGEGVGLTSSSSVHSQLANLERKGMLRKDPTKPRAIGLADDHHRPPGVGIPIPGRIAASAPVRAGENGEGCLTVPIGFAEGVDPFGLRVTGESMTGAGILDGDVVVVRRQDSAEDGNLGAAL